MIGFLRGKAVIIQTDFCLLDVNGVGYRLFIPHSTRNVLRLNETVQLFTYMNVYQDGITLYGFAAKEEYDLFQLLIGVSGIGPKVALGILSSISVDGLCRAIQEKQTAVLTKLPGIGKKSAERLILELRDKVGSTQGNSDDLSDGDFSADVGTDTVSEAIAALQSLGYTQAEILPVMKKVKNDAPPETIIKQALQFLGRA
ncbi:Holliday junction branch migration protein RuvA [Selenomonas sp. WCA-380-WT-3B 3/]|uniref:Holliday junction branch migration complex subunit RuvA n=1 Tax=Selenomonas montiformis TaxID=2652285 RepID=A0A6I2UYI0_9FIRM|nr:Holliday junction branch migration protein RuvA [Selenomonas montiformis]MSV24326.1 Holliday junction branch migration protein RuvA [Selenomonas montiformis]